MGKSYMKYGSISKLPKKSREGHELKGAYILGTIDQKQKRFYPRYVGSSFKDLIREIRDAQAREWEDGEKKNESFHFVKKSIKQTAKEAWEQECSWYHKFIETNDLTNSRHPKRDEGKNWICPVPDCCDECD